jgi:alpha-L-arabinofuranosidase
MNKKSSLHPSVQQFKQFVKKHPLLIKEVREGKKTWQDFYEEWTILGENDEIWLKFAEEENELNDAEASEAEKLSETIDDKDASQIGDLMSLLKNVNLNDIQSHIQNLSGIMNTVQGLLQTFQSSSTKQGGGHIDQSQQNQKSQQPFNFRHF